MRMLILRHQMGQSEVEHGRAWILVAVLAFLLVATACGTDPETTADPTTTAGPTSTADPEDGEVAEAATDEPPAELQPVRIGANRNLLYLAVFAAQDEGYFEEYGLDVEIVELPGGAELRTALLGGSTDVTVQVVEGSALLYEQGELVVNIVATQNALTWSVLLREGLEGEVEPGNVEDLRGMTLGVSGLGAGSDMQLQAYLRAGGLEPGDDVQIVAIGPYAAGITGMDEGQIDGMISIEPATTQAINAGHFSFVFFPDGEVYPGSEEIPMGSLAATASYIEEEPDIVGGVVRAIVDASVQMVNDPEWTVQYAAEITGAEVSDLETIVPDLFLPYVGADMSEEGWETLVEIMLDGEVITQPVPYEEVFATQFRDIWRDFDERVDR